MADPPAGGDRGVVQPGSAAPARAAMRSQAFTFPTPRDQEQFRSARTSRPLSPQGEDLRDCPDSLIWPGGRFDLAPQQMADSFRCDGQLPAQRQDGGANPQDRSVPLVVSGDPIGHHRSTGHSQVETTQIAPTILTLLGLNPNYLQAVRIEHPNTLNVR